MAPNENKGDTAHGAVGNLGTDRLPPTSAYLPLGPVRQRTKEKCFGSRLTAVTKTMISLGVIDEKSFTRECITKCLQALDDRLDIVTFATCEECLERMGSYDLVLYHIHEDVSTWENNYYKLTSLKKLLTLVPAIILSDKESQNSSVYIFEYGARGFISTDNTTLEQVIKIIGLVKVSGISVPLSVVSLRRNKGQVVTVRRRSRDQFTPSELAVLNRLKLGKPTKIIARELGRSENTVKVHISSIMKKLRVKNRTQIVCCSLALATAGMPSPDEV
jgi:DNA-binding NarL/FixJ family response regulator